MPARLCIDCSCLVRNVGGGYSTTRCDPCRAKQRAGVLARRGGTAQRGYGSAHQRARRKAIAALVDGDPCSRCGGPMYRVDARTLQLDHNDERTGYRGLAHGPCNERAGAQTANARAMAPSARIEC